MKTDALLLASCTLLPPVLGGPGLARRAPGKGDECCGAARLHRCERGLIAAVRTLRLRPQQENQFLGNRRGDPRFRHDVEMRLQLRERLGDGTEAQRVLLPTEDRGT